MAVFMPNSKAPEAETLGQRISHRSEHMVVTDEQGREVAVHVDVSYSTAEAHPGEALEPLLCIARAVTCPEPANDPLPAYTVFILLACKTSQIPFTDRLRTRI